MGDDQANSLLSAHKSSDSGLEVHLHPLVLLTISDYIARHVLRRQRGPIIGALLGQQSGREISLEHAFECSVVPAPGDTVILNEVWFLDRLQQYKDVHKTPALELVGWFTTAPITGPEPQHVSIHQQILKCYNETAVLLAFHPSAVLKREALGGKLPLTIYESVFESRRSEGQGAGDSTMEIVGGDAAHSSQLDLRFRELPYSIETGEAEMISVDFVARGGASSTADTTIAAKRGQTSNSNFPGGDLDPKTGGKPKIADAPVLTAEDEERMSFSCSIAACADRLVVITSLTARANAIKMLHARIQLLKSYLTNLPPSYMSYPPQSDTHATSESPPHTEINHPILRSIQALLSRLPLLLPDNRQAFRQERLAEKTDVQLINLLGTIGKSLKETRELGRKFSIVDQYRQSVKKGGQTMFVADDFYSPMTGGGDGGTSLTPFII
ncbi:hypothetical protein MMC31_001984 [Peltigera leucophlebia]|nr:hypothetical protein [Peltigera leucophlebia]